MNSSTIMRIVDDELARSEPFTNLHGITPATVRSFLVEPFVVQVDPDDLETQPRNMWVVLQEKPRPNDGYVVVFDPASKTWGVAELRRGNDYTLLISAPSLARAVNSM